MTRLREEKVVWGLIESAIQQVQELLCNAILLLSSSQMEIS